jgi:hypothetical protein
MSESKRMTEEDLRDLVEHEFSEAMGSSNGQISLERAKAWDYYLSKPLGNEEEGQSCVVTSDVADVVDGMMPSLLRIFTVSENLVDFDPVGPEDIQAAEQESDYVNHVFFKENPAFLILYTWFFDALVQKNGIAKVWWDESEEVTTESYQGLNEDELAALLDDDELEPVEQEEREGETVEAILGPDGQELQRTVVATLHDITFRRTSKSGRVRVEPVPPEEYRISGDSRSVDPSNARMVGHEREMTRSELRDMGFSKEVVDKLPAQSDIRDTAEKVSRRDKVDERSDKAKDRSQEQILVKEAYVRVDFDDDGRSELRHVIVAGKEVLSNEPIDRQPFHVITPQPLPHKHFGRALSEKVMDVQAVNTTLVRQILDNLYHTNNPEHAVWEQGIGENTMDDLLTRRVGKVNRFSRPPAESYQSMTVPFTAGQTFPMLEFFEKTKRDRTGISSDGEGLSPDALKNIQQSVLMQAADLSRMKIEAVVRIFAETGIKSLFLHIHELLLKHQQKKQIVMLRNKWVQVDPREWRTRHNMTVRIGLGIGTREQNLLHLNAIWEKQRDMVSNGGLGLTVMPKNLFNTAAEIVKNANLKVPEMFFTDPGDGMPEPQPDPQAQVLQMQMQIEQERNQLQQERNAMQHQREMLKLQQQQQEAQDRMTVEMEKIANKLTELELNSNRNVPGSRV